MITAFLLRSLDRKISIAIAILLMVAVLVPVQVAHLAGVQVQEPGHLHGLGLLDESGHDFTP